MSNLPTIFPQSVKVVDTRHLKKGLLGDSKNMGRIHTCGIKSTSSSRHKRLYYRWVSEGLCVRCGLKNDDTTRYCRVCLDKIKDKKEFETYKKAIGWVG